MYVFRKGQCKGILETLLKFNSERSEYRDVFFDEVIEYLAEFFFIPTTNCDGLVVVWIRDEWR